MSGSKLYKEKIIEHYKNPRHFGELDDPDFEAHVANSVCGDEIKVYLRVADSKVTDIAFRGSGCAICIAGMSMLTEKLIGASIQEIDEMDRKVPLKMLNMEERSPRIKCAILGLEAVKRAINMEGDDDCDFC